MAISVLKWRRYGILGLFTVMILFISACEKILLGDDPADEPVENFELLWKTLDEKYAFFTFKEIDWDAVYNQYRPQVHNEMTESELFGVMREMIFLLRDGHTSLTSPFDVARNWQWYLDSPPNYNYDIIEREYLGPGHFITGPFLHEWVDSVGYVHYRSFSGGFTNQQLSIVLNRFEDAKGLILDVRNNGGGNTAFGESLASRFTENEVLTQYWLYKNGPGHDDFSEPEAKYLQPYEGLRWNKPVIILTNRKCYSATNDFVLMMRSLPNVTLLGDTTGGGGGFPFNAELPNGWQYRFSSSMTIAPDGFNVEHGIPPDVQVNMSPADELEDVDTLIEAALDLLQ